MASAQQTAEKIKDILTLCLAKGIDEALTCTMAPNWFEYFRQDDSKKKKEHMILRPEQTSVYDLDFQALLKIMKFHLDIRMYILSYYRPNESDQLYMYYGKNSLFDNILYRLMTLYRNQIAAHKKAGDVEMALSGESRKTTYSYDDAITDMKRLAETFSTVTDANGNSYYATICNIADAYYNQSSYSYYSITETIELEQLNISKVEFMQICEDYGIKIAPTANDVVFASKNYAETIAIIKNQLNLIQSQKSYIESKEELLRETESEKERTRKRFMLAISAVAVLTVLVLIIFLVNLLDVSNRNSNRRRNSTTSTESVTAEETTAITTEATTQAIISDNEEGVTSDDGNHYLNMNNYSADEGILTIKPANVYYNGESITAKCYIINGTDHTVNSVVINDLEFFDGDEVICEAAFNASAVQVNLEPGDHYLQEFTFPANTVMNKSADLKNITSFCDIVEK